MEKIINEVTFNVEQALAATERFASRTKTRELAGKNLEKGKRSKVDTKERIAKRVNRLLDRVRQSTVPAVEATESASASEMSMSDELKELVAGEPVTEADLSDAFVERVLGETRDFLSIDFLDAAQRASQAVGRVVIELANGRRGFGTGFLVAPGLLLTNHHVFPHAADAFGSTVEFDFQRSHSPNPPPVSVFALAPDQFFLNGQTLDFALVAVKPTSQLGKPLAEFGCIPMIAATGKITVGEPINIIQHPSGEMKQIVLRENNLLDITDQFLHYLSDTEPGSSGSPVFNDQWELVCLHHSGVPKQDANGRFLKKNGQIWEPGVDDPRELEWIANEGVRVSQLVEHFRTAELKPAEKPLMAALLQLADEKSPPDPAPDELKPLSKPKPLIPVIGAKTVNSIELNGTSVTFTIPLQIQIRLGAPIPASGESTSGEAFGTGLEGSSGPSPKPVGNYEARPGFDEQFLDILAPLPKLGPAIKNLAAVADDGAENPNELKYFHYSVLYHEKRRLAFVSAVNYDGKAAVKQKRTGADKWYFDPRIAKEIQAGNEFYAANPFDRGHLTRRADSGWGATETEALQANDDTFHFTNCSPQHEITNQGKTAQGRGLALWGSLEEHVQKQAATNGKLSIYNGPIFRPGDRKVVAANGSTLQVPKEFFKVIAYRKSNGKLGAVGFVLTQEPFIRDVTVEGFEVGEFKSVQRSIASIEQLTHLKFGLLRNADALENEGEESLFESGSDRIVLDSLESIVL